MAIDETGGSSSRPNPEQWRYNNGRWEPPTATTPAPGNGWVDWSKLREDYPKPSSGSGGGRKTRKVKVKKELNTLTGTLLLRLVEKSLILKSSETVTLRGLGAYLSGDYYVSKVTRKFNSEGYSQEQTVLKGEFFDSLKPNEDEDSE